VLYNIVTLNMNYEDRYMFCIQYDFIQMLAKKPEYKLICL